jgi:ADP-ribosyl-[dinitrogen reductase] hydrolase
MYFSMDALAMALHCVHTTDSFSAALLKIVNMRGDSDSTGAVCGQIAGAM